MSATAADSPTKVQSKPCVQVLDIGLSASNDDLPCIPLGEPLIIKNEKYSSHKGKGGPNVKKTPNQEKKPDEKRPRRRWKSKGGFGNKGEQHTNLVINGIKDAQQELAGCRDAIREQLKVLDEKRTDMLNLKENLDEIAKINAKLEEQNAQYAAASASIEHYKTVVEYPCEDSGSCAWNALFWLLLLLFFFALSALFYLKDSRHLDRDAAFLGLCFLALVLSIQAFFVFLVVLGKVVDLRLFIHNHRFSIFFWFIDCDVVYREGITESEKDFSNWNPGFDLRPRALAQVDLCSPEARFKVKYVRGKYFKYSCFLGSWQLGDPNCAAVEATLRPSVALLSELVHGDICGMNSDIDVARQRIDARLRTIQSVNINRFSAHFDDIFGDTAIVALMLWRKRQERRKLFPI